MPCALLVCRFGVSRALYEEFLRPLLLVGLFAPPEELSAAAVLGTFYFYSTALCPQLQANAHVRSTRKGCKVPS
jgi:hypothetical protein